MTQKSASQHAEDARQRARDAIVEIAAHRVRVAFALLAKDSDRELLRDAWRTQSQELRKMNSHQVSHQETVEISALRSAVFEEEFDRLLTKLDTPE